MREKDLGSAVLIEAEFKKATAFGDDAYYDPSPAPKVTVTDPEGTEVIAAQDMTQSATGKYYYTVQSTTSWEAGYYDVKVTAGDGTNSDVNNQNNLFKLV